MERFKRSATRIIVPDITYEERLAHLSIPVLNDFIFEYCEVHFNKISKDENHSLYSRIVCHNLRISSREKNVSSRFRPVITEPRKGQTVFSVFYSIFACQIANFSVLVTGLLLENCPCSRIVLVTI